MIKGRTVGQGNQHNFPCLLGKLETHHGNSQSSYNLKKKWAESRYNCAPHHSNTESSRKSMTTNIPVSVFTKICMVVPVLLLAVRKLLWLPCSLNHSPLLCVYRSPCLSEITQDVRGLGIYHWFASFCKIFMGTRSTATFEKTSCSARQPVRKPLTLGELLFFGCSLKLMKQRNVGPRWQRRGGCPNRKNVPRGIIETIVCRITEREERDISQP
jgi:hypothetical protein